MGEQIHCTGSAIPTVRLVLDPQEGIFDSAKKLLANGAVNVVEGVKRQRLRILRVSDGRCFGSGCACRDDGRCTRIERGDNSCGRKVCIDGEGKGEAQVAKGAAAKVGGDGRRV